MVGRLPPLMTETVPTNFLDKARGIAAAGMMAAGGAAILGSLLDWVTIESPAGFTGQPSIPFTGIEARDGWYVIIGAAIMIVLAGLLTWRRRGLYAWLGFLDSVVIGIIAIADYRGVNDLTSTISRRMDIIGDAEAGVGLILVAVAALVGVLASLTGVAATPSSATED